VATNGICNSFKVEVLQAAHCFNAVVSTNGTTHTNTTLDGLSSTAGIAVGAAITGGDVGAGAVVASVTSASALVMSVAASGSTTASRTFTSDAFKFALVKVSPATTFGPTMTNIGTPGTGASSTSNLGTDEAATGTGYSSGGIALTNVTPALSTTTATTSFSPSPALTLSGAFSCTAGIIYNNSIRLGAAATPLGGRTVGVYDFGGTVSVGSSGGTITFTMPVNAAGTAIIQIS